MGALQVFHARNDYDISFKQTEIICRRVVGEAEVGKCVDDGAKGGSVVDVREEGRARARFEIVEYGGKVSAVMCLMRVSLMSSGRT